MPHQQIWRQTKASRRIQLAFLRIDRDVRGEALGRHVLVIVDGELMQFNGKARLHHLVVVGKSPPLGVFIRDGHLEFLHIGTAQSSGDDGDENAQVVQQERNFRELEV